MAKKNEKDMIDFMSFFKDLISKWWIFAITIVVCVGLAFLYTKIKQDKYLVKANLLISTQDDSVTDMGNLGNIFGSDAYVEDEVFLVSSHTVLRDVVKELGLNKRTYVREGFMKYVFEYRGAPLELYCDPAIADTLTVGITFKVKISDKGLADVEAKVRRDVVAEVEGAKLPVTMNTPYGKFIINKTKTYPKGESMKARLTFNGYDNVAEDLAEDIVVDIASRKSNVINMEMETTDVPYAEDVLNHIIAQYNQRGVNDKAKSDQATLDFLESRLALLSDDLSNSEHEIEAYKKSNNIVELGADVTYQMEKKGKLEAALIEAETNLQVVKLIKDFISNPANQYELVPASLISNGENNALSAYNELILRRIELSQNARGNNSALNAINEQIDAMRKNIISTVDRTYETALVSSEELRREMGVSDSRLNLLPTQERQFRDIKRQQSIKEQLYIFLLKQREQTSMLLANAQPKGLIVDEAYALNEPLGMTKKMLLLIAAFLGVVLGVVIIFLQRKFRNKFESKDELEQITDVPILGEVCTSKSSSPLVVRQGGSTSAAELFRLIRTNLQFVLGGKDQKVILMTSTISGEGKSFVSINLASSLALLGKKVLLIGLDIRNPKLAEYLDLPPHLGFTEYISSDEIPLEKIIRRNAIMEGMDIITAGPVPPNPAELLNSERVDALFDELRTMYDYIIIDSAPVGMVSDTFSLVRLSDATVYVCRANYSTMKEVKFFNDLYDEGRLKKMSLVVNGTTAKKGYGYGYGKIEKES